MASAIIVENVTRRFGDLVAVDRLSLTVAHGELFGLLGPNGAGKTTAIHLITGMLARDEGRITVLDHDPQREARAVRASIGYVPQETNLFQDLNAEENLWHHAALYCPDLKKVRVQIRELLELMQLWNRRKEQVRNFSGGMKRRLALARTLLHDPAVIFFDEPTLGVDVQGKHALWEHIRAQQKLGKTFVVSTNDMAEAEALCEQVLIIDQGRSIVMDTPDHLKASLGRDVINLRTTPAVSNPDNLLAGLGIASLSEPEPAALRLEVPTAERVLGEIVRRISAQVALESVQMSRPTLDDVFLHFTGRALRE